MNNVATFFGWFCLAMLGLAGVCLAVALAAHCCEKALQRFEWAVDAKTRNDVGRSIGASAWWFSESPDTSLALRILAERLMSQGGADADQWREQWRKARQSAPQTSEKP